MQMVQEYQRVAIALMGPFSFPWATTRPSAKAAANELGGAAMGILQKGLAPVRKRAVASQTRTYDGPKPLDGLDSQWNWGIDVCAVYTSDTLERESACSKSWARSECSQFPTAAPASPGGLGRGGNLRFDRTLVMHLHSREENDMNWDQIEGNWKQFKGKARQQWGKLTDDEVDRVEGRREELAGLIQEKYGKSREDAEREIDDWLGKH